MLAFLWVFALAVQMIKFDLTESYDQIMFVSILSIYNLRYSTILQLIIFIINLDAMSSSKVFNIFDFVLGSRFYY